MSFKMASTLKKINKYQEQQEGYKENGKKKMLQGLIQCYPYCKPDDKIHIYKYTQHTSIIYILY